MKAKIGIVFIALIIVAGAFFSTSFTGQVSQKEASSGIVKNIAVQIGNSEFSFDKPNLQLSRGDTVEVTFKNTGQYPHNWVAPELNAAIPTISPGQSASVKFDAEKEGNFEVLCTVPGHKERGMIGVLSVE